MRAAMLCREMGWSWQEYCSQPQWLVFSLLSMMQNEAEQANNKQQS
jgi:hypothetical protein